MVKLNKETKLAYYYYLFCFFFILKLALTCTFLSRSTSCVQNHNGILKHFRQWQYGKFGVRHLIPKEELLVVYQTLNKVQPLSYAFEFCFSLNKL